LGKLIVRVQCKVDQKIIGWSGNLGRISEPERVFSNGDGEKTMLFDDLTPKSRDNN